MSSTFKRRNKFPKPRLQLRLAAGFMGVTLLALLANAVLTGYLIVNKAGELSVGSDELHALAADLVLESLGLSIVLLLPATLLVGVAWTFRTAGPIYHLEEHFRALARGESVGPCTIRAGDELQELCSLVNEAHARMAAQPERADDRDPSQAA